MLLGVEAFEAAALRDPVGLDDVGRGQHRGPDGSDFAAMDEVREAESVSSTSVSGSGRWI
jgi:hypothetical protein